jgi:hypothetical protein
VLTGESPSAGGIEAIQEIAEQLFATPPPSRGGWTAP